MSIDLSIWVHSKIWVCYCVFVATHGTSISSTHPAGKGPRTPLIFPGPSRHLPSHSPKLPTRLVPAMDRRCLRVRRTPAAAARPQAAKPAPAGWSGKKQKGWPCSTFVRIARFLLQASLYDSLNCLGIFEQSQLARGNVFCMFYLQASQTALSLSLSLWHVFPRQEWFWLKNPPEVEYVWLHERWSSHWTNVNLKDLHQSVFASGVVKIL